MKSQKHHVNPFIKNFFNFVTSLEKEMASDNFNFTEMRILFELWENGTVSAKSLENELDLDKGYISRLIARLVSEKIIEKKQASDDKRFYDLYFTKEGEVIARNLYEKYEKLIMNDYKKLDITEQSRFLESLYMFKQLERPINEKKG